LHILSFCTFYKKGREIQMESNHEFEMQNAIFLLLAILFAVLQTNEAEIRNGVFLFDCDSNQTQIYAGWKSVIRIENNLIAQCRLSTSLKKAYFWMNRIKTISKFNFRCFTNLINLQLGRNKIETIEERAFDSVGEHSSISNIS